MSRTILVLCLLLSLPWVVFAQNAVEKDIEREVRRYVQNVIRVDISRLYLPMQVPSNAKLVFMQPSPPLGSIIFQYEWMNGSKFQRIQGNATTRVFAKVAVAKNSIKHGDAFSQDNVRFEERDLSPIAQTGYFLEPKAIETLAAQGYIRPGAVLNGSNTTLPKEVNAGQMIEVTSEKGSLRIVAKMRALESGERNRWIRVENPGTRRVMQARVTGSGQANMK